MPRKLTAGQCRTSAVMWSFAVMKYGAELRAEADRHLAANRGEVEATVAAAWQLTLARYTFLHAVHQLLKCTARLKDLGETPPELKDHEVVRLLRNVDDHWEDVDSGWSMAALAKRLPDERPTRVVYSAWRVELGGLLDRDILKWAAEVDEFVRAAADNAGTALLKPDDPID